MTSKREAEVETSVERLLLKRASNEDGDKFLPCGADVERLTADITRVFLPATQQSGDGLEQALEEAIELAHEGWAYASPYFCEKWQFQERIDKLQAALDASRASGGGGDQ